MPRAKKPTEPARMKLEDLQAVLHYETYEALLADIRDPEKRTPALIQAALKAMAQAGIQVDPTAIPLPGTGASQLQRLTQVLPPILMGEEDADGDDS